MGIIGEALAAATAKKLEKIILSAMKGGCWGSVRSAVRGFVNEELVEWYYDECGESYGLHEPNEQILKTFPPKELKEDI